ncbi:MAG: hypothetical protein M3R00_05600, partial [Pseudomonadota bacterium]|nr:hypothetical protein [Pseudomonadota bacterium]
MSQLKRIASYSKELRTILLNIEPGDEYHQKLDRLRKKMENAYPSLLVLPNGLDRIPDDLLKAYAYLIASVMYDKDSEDTITKEDYMKIGAVLIAMERQFKFNPQNPELCPDCDVNELCTYGHLVLLMTNHIYVSSMVDDSECIHNVKYIVDLFQHFFPGIDDCSLQQFELYLDNDDIVRLYVLSKLAYADMLAETNPSTSSLYAIKKIYLEHIFQRLGKTKHLTIEQVSGTLLAIAEINKQIILSLKEEDCESAAALLLIGLGDQSRNGKRERVE